MKVARDKRKGLGKIAKPFKLIQTYSGKAEALPGGVS
jgi:hypothetical protein